MIGLAVVEVVLQVGLRRNWANPIPYGMRCTNLRETYYIGLAPDYTGVNQFGVEYVTNSMGFREEPVQQKEHVFFLGDSTTFGINILHEQTFPELVEADLVQAGSDVQCLNFGTPGQGTIAELRVLDQLVRIEELQPRAVVLGFFENDFSNNMWFQDYLELRKDRPDANQPLALGPIVNFENRFRSMIKLRLRAFVYELREGQKVKSALRNPDYRSDPGRAEDRNEFNEFRFRPGREVEWSWLPAEELPANRSFQTTVAALAEIVRLCDERDLPLIVLYLPNGDREILAEEDPVYKVPLELAALEVGVDAWVDGLAVYRTYLSENGLEELPEGFYSSPGDAAHPGPLASRILADALMPVLAKLLGP
jgi:lysophospholipase L1-like esterase